MAVPTSRLRVALASFALLALVCDVPSSAQEGAAPPTPPPPPPLSAEKVAELVAPIALYPDALLGQVLTASTYPLEVVMAARWSKANPNIKGQALEGAMQQQQWDPSVKALAAVPQVLAMMSDKLEWTRALGDAYLAQPDDIATAVQQLRARADAAGNLKPSNEQQIRRVAAPPPLIAGEPYPPEYYIIEPVNPDVIYVPIYDPYLVYGAWPYPAYRPFYWRPPGYSTVGVLAFGAPVLVGAALWATYDWRARRVAVDVNRFNTFNRAALTSRTWQHNPLHRGNLPYNNPTLQQRFGKTGTGVQGLSRTGIGGQGLPQGSGAANPQLSPTGTTIKTEPGNTNVNRNVNLGNTRIPENTKRLEKIGSPGNTKNFNAVNPNRPTGTTIKTEPRNTNVNRNVNLGNTRIPENTKRLEKIGSPGNTKNLNAVNPNLNKNVTVNRNVHRNISGNLNVHRNVTLPRANVGFQGAAKGAAKESKQKGRP